MLFEPALSTGSRYVLPGLRITRSKSILAHRLLVALGENSKGGNTMAEAPLAKPVLYRHAPHAHSPVNVNYLIEAEHEAAGFNQHVAMGMTRIFSAMPTFWLIVAWIVTWISLNATVVRFDPLPWPLLLCLASVPQLPLMIVIMVGQGLLGRKQELQAEEQYNTTIKTYHDIEQMMEHLSAQDAELLKQSAGIALLLRRKTGGET